MNKVKSDYSKEELVRLFVLDQKSRNISRLQECAYILVVVRSIGAQGIADKLGMSLPRVNSLIQQAKGYLQSLGS